MDDAALERLEALLATRPGDPLLRFTLGQECLKRGRHGEALNHLGAAVAEKPDYAAAWKLLGKAQEAAENADAAHEAYRRGIEVARANGDKQLEREMGVYLRRLER